MNALGRGLAGGDNTVRYRSIQHAFECVKRLSIKRYSVIALTLCYIFALLHKASTLWRKVIAFFSYRFRLMEFVTVSKSYRSGANVIAFYSYCPEKMKSIKV
jgi:hypothetical protein